MKRSPHRSIVILLLLLSISGCIKDESSVTSQTTIMSDELKECFDNIKEICPSPDSECIQREQDHCILNDVAFNRSTLCNMVKSDSERNDCYYLVAVENTQDESFCMEMQNNVRSLFTRDDCLEDILMKREKVLYKDCMKISPGYGRDDCLEKSALDNIDLSICDKIDGELDRRECKLGIIKNTSDFTKCDSVFKKENIRDRTDCYWYAMKATKNVTWCLKMPDPSVRYCQAVLNRNLSLCDYMTKNNEYVCIRLVAIEINDSELCDRIPKDEYEFDYCIWGVVEKSGDITLCDSIQHNITREICIKEVGMQT